MTNKVIGFFDDAAEAQEAVDELLQYGIDADNIEMSDSGVTPVNEKQDYVRDDKSDNAITRFFKNLFGDDSEDARKYAQVGSSAKYIVAVEAASSEQAEEVADILDDCGAIDVDERAGRFGSGQRLDTDDRNSTGYSSSGSTRGQNESIQRAEEQLNVGKKEIEKGSVRVRSRIVETPVEERIRLREENIDVQRNPVNRRISADDNDAFQEQDIELTERAEIPVVNKEARVVEEISLNKEVNERDELIRDTVRKTEVDIDKDRKDVSNEKDSDRLDYKGRTS
jgi:stress response protein YsnF